MKLTQRSTAFYHLRSLADWEGGLMKVRPLRAAKDWESLRDYYGEGGATSNADPENRRDLRLRPWRRCLAVARQNGAKSVLVERRYIDRNYRSEYSALYSQVLAPVADTTHRLHFFSTELPADLCVEQLAEDKSLQAVMQENYIGYVVCRPAPLELVGRTMLRPPPSVSVRTSVEEIVNLFGTSLIARGVPFMQQDRRLGVCAHIAIWSMLYSAFQCGDAARQTIAEVVRTAHGIADGRLGLNDDEVVTALQQAKLRPQMYDLDFDLPPKRGYPWLPGSNTVTSFESDERAGGVMPSSNFEADLERRVAENLIPVLNSGIAVYGASASHAFVICGYSTRSKVASALDFPGDEMRPGVVYTVHDDQVGPYIQVYSPLRDFRILRDAQVSEDLSPESIRRAERVVMEATLEDTVVRRFAEENDLDVDELGKTPTRVIENRRDWQTLILPLPGNVHISFDAAERHALTRFNTAILRLVRDGQSIVGTSPFTLNGEEMSSIDLGALRSTNSLSVRSYMSTAQRFKTSLTRRDYPQDVIHEYQKCRLAANVHVVELLYDDFPSAIPRVIGEIVIDSTSGDAHPWVHAMRLGHDLYVVKSSGELLAGTVAFDFVKTGFPGARSEHGRRSLVRWSVQAR